jgi:hypothetical protein
MTSIYLAAAFVAGTALGAVLDAVHSTRAARRIGRQAAREHIEAHR